MTKHYKHDECMQFLQQENPCTSATEHQIIERYSKIFTDGLDFLLLLFTQILGSDDVHNILVFLRAYGILDRSDYERISNDRVFPNSERKATELLTAIEQREPHAFWYLAHSLKTKRLLLFEKLHGNIQCCVCKEIQTKEAEIRELRFSGLAAELINATPVQVLTGLFEEKCASVVEGVKNAAENLKSVSNKVKNELEGMLRKREFALEKAVQVSGMADGDRRTGYGNRLTEVRNSSDNNNAEKDGKDQENSTEKHVSLETHRRLMEKKRAYKYALVSLSMVTLYYLIKDS